MPGFLNLETVHDEASREAFVLALKLHINTGLGPALRDVYEHKAAPRLYKDLGRPPKDRHEIRKAMTKEPTWQSWASLWSTSQGLMWDAIGDEIDRLDEDLRLAAKPKRKPRGSLRIVSDFAAPRYVADVHIHGQPGGYDLDLSDDDVTAGAYCEGAGRIYARGQGVVAKGNKAIHYLFEDLCRTYPKLKPGRILDIGCNTGGSTLAAKAYFPEAEVHGIDIGAGLMRYAHARAELQGVSVHFATQNGERTDFPDGYFDLIVSGTLLHEMSFKAMYNLCGECHRLLSPGGVMAHLEVALRHRDVKDLYFQFYRDWSTHYNAEPFWGKLHDMDVIDPMIKGGFRSDDVWEKYFPTPSGAKWWAMGAQRGP